jgi:transposase-like protein
MSKSSIEQIICDFETGIHNAIRVNWPTVTIQGCRFHYGQALQRWLSENRMGPNVKNPTFFNFFRSMLALPMARPRDLAATLAEMRSWKMPTAELEVDKNRFLDYFDKTWMGTFPPGLWTCFGRRDDMTNNAQEAYNGMLNRLVATYHPNPNILLGYLVAELHNAEYKLTGQMEGKF